MEQYIIFNLSDKKFAIELKYVNEISQTNSTTKIINTPLYITGIVYIRNDVYTVVDLSELFAIKIQPKFPKTILCTCKDENIAFRVEEVSDIVYLNSDKIIEKDLCNFMNFINKIVEYNNEPIYIINISSIINYKEDK